MKTKKKLTVLKISRKFLAYSPTKTNFKMQSLLSLAWLAMSILAKSIATWTSFQRLAVSSSQSKHFSQ